MSVLFNPKEIVPAFDRFLEARHVMFAAVAIGGAALSILGVIARTTRDVDILEPAIPDDVRRAAADFAQEQGLATDWLNIGPAHLSRDLPSDLFARTQPLYLGTNLRLSTLARIDLIRTKLFAMCDRMRDIDDLVALNPTDDELALAVAWATPLDRHPDWPAHVRTSVDALRRRLGRA